MTGLSNIRNPWELPTTETPGLHDFHSNNGSPTWSTCSRCGCERYKYDGKDPIAPRDGHGRPLAIGFLKPGGERWIAEPRCARPKASGPRQPAKAAGGGRTPP